MRDDGDGQTHRDLAHQLDSVGVDRVEQGIDAPLDPGREGVVEAATHRSLDKRATLGVAGRVVVDEDNDAAGVVDPGLAGRRKDAGIAEDLRDIGVSRHHPGAEVWLVVGRGATQEPPVAGIRSDGRVGSERPDGHGARLHPGWLTVCSLQRDCPPESSQHGTA